MSFKHLEEKHGELILYLQKNGYSSGIISNIRTVIKDIINNADFNGWSAYLNNCSGKRKRGDEFISSSTLCK